MTTVHFESDAPLRYTCILLICTLVSENQGLEKSGSISNPRQISGSLNLKKIQVPNLKKSIMVCRT
jgi:hypothetical protein